jgi:trigger factor
MPKDLPDKDVAGKKVVFKVEILNIKKIIKPKIDNKFAEKFGHKNPSELKKAIKASLVEEKKENELQKINAKISEQIIKLTKVEIPKSLIDSEVARIKQSMEEGLKKQGLTYEKYLADSGVDPDKAQKDLENQAKMNVTLGVGLSEIAKREKVEITSQDGMKKVYDKIIEICSK